jgi:hypothetical protein
VIGVDPTVRMTLLYQEGVGMNPNRPTKTTINAMNRSGITITEDDKTEIV